GHIGHIISRAEAERFALTGLRFLQLTTEQAEEFYAVHRERPFFGGLIRYITSGPVVVGRLERENAVEHWRSVIGSTDPKKAAPGTIRALYGINVERNTVHGSDSVDNGIVETRFFFPE
ncbi:MAG: nucleoside-diphosphate kinase, partial [Calditrichaeota bacterium]|nr:nucleoside-diphosphate kinase [Calditrichota bacterium]